MIRHQRRPQQPRGNQLTCASSRNQMNAAHVLASVLEQGKALTLPSGWILQASGWLWAPLHLISLCPLILRREQVLEGISEGTLEVPNLRHISLKHGRRQISPRVAVSGSCQRFSPALQISSMQPCRDKTVHVPVPVVLLARNVAVSSCRSSGTLLPEICERELAPVVGHEATDPPSYLAWITTFVLPNLHAFRLFSGSFCRTRYAECAWESYQLKLSRTTPAVASDVIRQDGVCQS
jgi:hypothetical protein